MLPNAVGMAFATVVVVSAPTSPITYGRSIEVSPSGAQPTGAGVAAAVAAQQQQLNYQQAYLLYLYQQQVAAGSVPYTPAQLGQAASEFFTNGAAATSVPTTGPGAAFYNNGAGLFTAPPTSFPAVTNPALGAGAFGDMTQGAVSPSPAPAPSPSLPPPPSAVPPPPPVNPYGVAPQVPTETPIENAPPSQLAPPPSTAAPNPAITPQ
jgi:hypothetical protein